MRTQRVGLTRIRSWASEAKDLTKRALRPVLHWRPGLKDGGEIVLIGSALPLYYLVRGVSHQNIPDAVARGVDIINLEQSLRIFWEVELQTWAMSYTWLITFLNWFYLYGHLPVIGALAVWLYFWHRPQYLLMRNAFLISGAIGLVIFLNFPTAPPRLLPDGVNPGFVDTIYEEFQKSRPGTPSFFVNEYAAMPSLHFGWNLLVGIAMWMASKNLFIRIFAVLMPFTMLVSIVLTGNHYILDGVAGFIVMSIGLAAAFGGRWLVLRILSPDSRAARERGRLVWLYWLCGVPEHKYEPNHEALHQGMPQPA